MPVINRGDDYFQAITYTGNGSTQTISGLRFQPDFVWIKGRSGATDHALYDAQRGVQKRLESNTTDAEASSDNGVTAFTSDGFTLGSLAQVNTNGATYVAWCWKESATAGFDIVTWAGNSTSGRAITHSLGVAPKMIITKSRTNAASWVVGIGGMSGFGVNDYLTLQTTNAKASSSTFYQAYGSSTFTVGVSAADEMNKTGNNYVSYLFSEVAGFSKFGSYTGNGSADGPFVFCGFRPRWIMVKRTDAAGENWMVYDTSRDLYNYERQLLHPNSSAAEYTSGGNFVDNLSNGVKIRSSDTALNASGGTYIFAAFAENPFKNSLAR